MSGESNTNAYKRPTATSHLSIPTNDTKHAISRLDSQLEFLVDKVLPRAPYLISIPSDVPYRHNPHFVNNWHRATPFAREEEPLQYMSFLTHQDQEQGLVKAVGGWSDDKGNFVEEDPSPQQSYASSANSPIPGLQRKKITLNDYKTKTKVTEPPTKPEMMGDSDQQRSRGQGSHINGVSEKQSSERQAKPGTPVQKSRERKRSLDNVEHTQSASESPRPGKKPRTDSPSRKKSPGATVDGTQETSPSQARVPSLISPTLPLSGNAHDVPTLLSPTLPSPIEALLLREPDPCEATETTSRSRTQSAPSPSTTRGLDKTSLSAAKKTVLSPTHEERDQSPSLPVAMKDAKSSPGARGAGSTSSPGPRRRRTIILRYGKRNRKRVEALLKFAPRNRKQLSKRAEVVGEENNGSVKIANGVASSRLESPGKQGKDGPKSQPPESPPNHRKFPPSSLHLAEKPSTPIPAAFKSPSFQNSLQPRPYLSTPKKDLKPTAMRRVESSEGVDVGTPLSSMTRQSTPVSTEKGQASTHNHHRPSSPPESTSIPSHRDDNRRAWKAFHTRYHELGRTIKHEGSSFLQQEGTGHEKQGALLSIEALLCFMLSQVAQTYAIHGSDPGWRTMLPYISFVRRVSKAFPPLHGLTSQLGAVCRQTISHHDLIRLDREAFPEEQTHPVEDVDNSQHSSSAANTHSSKARRRWQTFRTELTDNARELQRLWLDGYHTLSPAILQMDFPDTWNSRASDPTIKTIPGLGPSQDVPPSLSVPLSSSPKFHLPLDSNTGVMEAVRYASSVLAEWAAKEKATWKCRIEGAGA